LEDTSRPRIEEDSMAPNEPDEKQKHPEMSEEPDVGAHRKFAADEPKVEPEDDGEDEAPDVEGQMFKQW
jgi:hypothetical protein